MRAFAASFSAPFVVCLAILVCSAAGLGAAINSLGLHLRKLPIQAERTAQAVPTETESWRRLGRDVIESAAVLEELGTDNYLTRTYARKPDGAPPRLELHLAYYTGMVDTVPHVPERCLVGGGWVIGSGTWVLPVELDRSMWLPDRTVESNGRGKVYTARLSEYSDLPGTRVRLPRGVDNLQMRITEFVEPRSGDRYYAGYFFIANGEVMASAEQVRLRAFDLRADYAFYLKVQIASAEVDSARELADAAGDLLSELLPEIVRCVPDWVEVERGAYPPDNPRRERRAG